jgi:predicted patatin/cPLA2 family phospholipase
MALVLDGGGTITGLTVGGLTDATIQQADLAPNVAGNGPAFSAYQSTAQSALSAAAYTKLLFQTKEFDTNSRFNNTGSTVNGIPAYAFMPDVAGYYQVNTAVQHNTSFETLVVIYKNGSQHRFGIDVNSSWSSVASALVYLNGTTDYIEVYAYFASSVAPNIGPQNTYFQAAMVRAA